MIRWGGGFKGTVQQEYQILNVDKSFREKYSKHTICRELKGTCTNLAKMNLRRENFEQILFYTYIYQHFSKIKHLAVK